MRSVRWIGVMALAVLVVSAAACAQEDATPTPAPTITPPTASPATPTPRTPPPDALTAIPVPPTRDPLELARRYGVHAEALPDATLFRREPEGTRTRFWSVDPRPPEMFTLDATLALNGERAAWHIEDGSGVSPEVLREAARRFDEEIAPAVLELMAPGLELPGPIAVVVGELPAVAGYFSAGDTRPAEAYRFSNERAAIFLSLAGELGSEGFMGTLAHEFHHLIQWRVDPTEETWVNEGLAELAAREAGLPALPLDRYLQDPSVSITDWPEEPGASIANYAGAALLMTHLADVTGRANLERFVAESSDGVLGIQAYLDAVAPGRSFAGLYADWAVSNLLEPPDGAEGRAAIQAALSSGESHSGEVPQMGVYYVSIDGTEPVNLSFDGSDVAQLVPDLTPETGSCWWGNRGDGINATLARQVDLTGTSRATLRFRTWYDLEEDWDRGYVAVTSDGGATWEPLPGTLTTGEDPVGTSLGHSYTGSSGTGRSGWVREEMDLTPFAGGVVQLRFEHVTDESVHGAGWCVDDIEIPEIGFVDDGVQAMPDWDARGFVRVPFTGMQQRFTVRLIDGAGAGAPVRTVALDEANAGTVRTSGPSTLVIVPLSWQASSPASFHLRVTP